MATHAHVHAMVIPTTVGVVQQHEVEVGSPASRRRERRGDLVRGGQPAHVAHRQPVGDRRAGALPEPIERRLDDRREFAAHPALVDAVRADEAIAGGERALEFRVELAFRARAQGPLARPRLTACLQLPNQVSTPAMVAVMNVAIEPPSTARNPKRARSLRRSGASPPMPPIWIAIELKLANPHSAYVAIRRPCSVSDTPATFPFTMSPSCRYATNSLMTTFCPMRLPTTGASCHGVPITHASGAST